MRNNYYRKMAILGVSFLTLLAFKKYTDHKESKFPEISFVEDASSNIILFEFNPNDLDSEEWQKLGFSENQSRTILKYKDIVGGNFISKEQFRKCFAVSKEKYAQLEPFLLLPDNGKSTSNFSNSFADKKSLTISGKFNPDHFSEADWRKMGFSEKQSAAILKYKDYLGGSFVSKEKFKDCFIINDENYKKLEPFLILPAKTPANFNSYASKSASNVRLEPFNPNSLDVKGWIGLGFSEKQATVIVNYRDRNLKGNFRSLDDIKNCFVISKEKFDVLKSFIRLDPSTINNKPSAKTELKQEKTDFSKTDMNSITFKQHLEFGLDEKSAGSMIGFRKKLGGFMTKEQILETYNIDKELVQKLLSIAPLDNSKVERYTLVDAPEDWLKNHPYFKYSADKIIYYRISNPDDRKIWKLLKTKPEYEARMKLYLK